jgi:hypothetical protein
MFPFALGIITEPLRRLAQPILAALAVAFLVAAGVQTWRLHSAQTTLATERQAAAVATLRALEEAHARETDNDTRATKALTELEAARAELRQVAERNAALLVEIRLLRRTAADADRLREQLAAYAAGRTGDPAATCEDRAASLGAYAAAVSRAADEVAESAVEFAQLAVSAARDRDATAADFVACVKAWPK